MKKLQDILFSSALVVAAGAGMASCSSSDDIAEAPVNPSFDGENVKTQFAINIATPVTQNKTRMTDENTQNNNSNFLGMDNIKLMTFKSGDNLNVTTSSNQRTSDTQLDQIISLQALNTLDITTDKSSKIYSDVYIPVGTTNFLFYGTGPIGSTDNDDRFKKGTLTVPTLNSGQNLSNIQYSLVTALSLNNGFRDTAKDFADYLDNIASSSYTNSTTSTTYTWASLPNSDTEWTTLRTAYENFTKVGSTGARGGSANAILFTLKQLYEICVALDSSSDDDVKGLAGAIKNNITNNSTIKVKAEADYDESNTNIIGYTLSYNGIENKYNTFPTTYGLPEGAAQLTFNETNKFEYKTTGQIGSTATNVSFDPNNVTFPAALTYFVNTPARATTKEIPTAGSDAWPKTVNAWDEAWDSTTGSYKDWTTTVNSNSRTVALQYNINYGVACLATTVQCANQDYLEDNSAIMNNESSNLMIAIPTGGFKVTGILIGGQSKTVGWDFLDPTQSNQIYVVYDKDLNGINAQKGTASSKNYTLVFDNYVANPTDSKQPAVNIALELENGDEEFFGVDGRIAPKQKFYLVAKLDPNTNTGTITWPEGNKSNFPASEVSRVFIQDYITTANFTINSLKNAYVTIPDLRTSQLQLGLSVDLEWKTGLTFEVPID